MDAINIIPLFVAIPLAGAFLISLAGKRVKKAPDLLSNLTTFILAVLSVYSIFVVNTRGTLVYKVGGWIPPIGIAMVMDSLTSFMLVTVNIITFFVALYSISYMEKFTAKWKFHSLFLLMLAGMNGVIVTGDMFNLFVFLEIASIASYALVAYGTEHEELEASFKYMVMGNVASLFILLGIVFLYSVTSTLNMADMGMSLLKLGGNKVVLLVMSLFILGFGLKGAFVPFHGWLPDAHPSAPAPISAMLSGLLIKVLGVYALIRIFFNVIGASQAVLNILLAMGLVSMVVGALLAIGQNDIKRMFAYSSISQIGYVIVGFGLATPLAIAGALLHLMYHAVFKSLLFLNSGAIEYSTGTRNLDEMGGLNARLPFTGFTGFVGSMSIAGMPPFNGFWSKLIIIIAAVQSQHYIIAVIAVLVSIITLAYYLKFQKNAFLGKLKTSLDKAKEVPLTMKVSMLALALICLVSGILLIPVISNTFLKNTADIILQGKNYAVTIFRCIK